jgi:hypothetical protein
MKIIAALLLLISINAQAQCYTVNNRIYCQQDYRNDYNSPKLYDQNGNYRGNLNGNQYDPNSISNPYGQYGSKYSPNSINNPYSNINNGIYIYGQ